MKETKEEIGGIEMARDLTGYKISYLYQLVSRNEIPFHQIKQGGKLIFIKSELLEWIKSLKNNN